jgi:hypothetical protein
VTSSVRQYRDIVQTYLCTQGLEPSVRLCYYEFGLRSRLVSQQAGRRILCSRLQLMYS